MIIYLIRNKVNGKGYVGKTIRPLEERWYNHICGDLAVDVAIREYGRENFEMCVLAEAQSLPQLNALEKLHVKEQGTKHPNGYNLTNGGGRSRWEKGATFSAAHREKLSLAKRGKKVSAETKIRMSEAAKGKIKSEAHRANLSAALKGNKNSQARWDAYHANNNQSRLPN